MTPSLVALRRRVPMRWRIAALRLVNRLPERAFDLALPGDPPRTLAIRTPAYTHVSRVLETTGLAEYEPDTLACFMAAVEEQGFGPVYDIGANIGVFSWLAAALTPAPVVAFEPTPDLVHQMRAICDANGLTVTIEQVAAGAAPGTARLYLSSNTDSSNSLRKGFRRSYRSVKVAVESVDGYAERTGLVPAVLKIDTEATEPEVLRGAAAVIARHRPWIICEVLAGRTEAALTDALTPFGYAWYRIDGPGPLERRIRIEGDASYTHLNWLFAPDPPGASFWAAYERWRAAIARTSAES